MKYSISLSNRRLSAKSSKHAQSPNKRPQYIKFAATLILLLTSSLLSHLTLAADRTVCFRMKFVDSRTNCATAGETGARRACTASGFSWMVGHQVELWDKDTSSDDEKIGTWYIANQGTQCITFPWEGESYHKGESHPDLYLRYINKVNRTGYSNYVYIKGVDTGGASASATTWRNGSASNSNAYVARNCTGSCTIFPSGTLWPTSDAASERAQRIMALDSAQHALQVFGEVMDTHAEMRYPGGSDCPTSCARDRDVFDITESRGDNGFNVAHEVGHLVQMQEFNQDWLRDDCSRNGNGHSLGSIEHESCATTEGWANFAGVVSWYEPNNSGTTPLGWGADFEAGTPRFNTCSSNAHNTHQVAKAFWDLDDWNNENGVSPANGDDDNMAYSTTHIARGWRQFDNGSGNRDDGESGADGVNMRDYYANNTSRFSNNFFETFIEHNCLQAQTNN